MVKKLEITGPSVADQVKGLGFQITELTTADGLYSVSITRIDGKEQLYVWPLKRGWGFKPNEMWVHGPHDTLIQAGEAILMRNALFTSNGKEGKCPEKENTGQM